MSKLHNETNPPPPQNLNYTEIFIFIPSNKVGFVLQFPGFNSKSVHMGLKRKEFSPTLIFLPSKHYSTYAPSSSIFACYYNLSMQLRFNILPGTWLDSRSRKVNSKR